LPASVFASLVAIISLSKVALRAAQTSPSRLASARPTV
jgi:hypothetical protein